MPTDKYLQDVSNSLASRLFPFPSRLHPKRGTRQYRQVRALTAMLITTTATTLFWTIVVGILYFMGDTKLLRNINAALIVLTVLGLQTACFYRFANVRFSAAFLSISYFFMVCALVLASGGYDSPNRVLAVTSPIISFRISGRDEGIMNSVFVSLFVLFLLFAKQQGFALDNYLSSMSDMLASTIAWFATLTVIASCLATYDIDE